MNGSKLLFLAFILLLNTFRGSAQIACKDEFLVDPWYDCGTSFDPVCGCDGNTYRNQCAARYHGGVINNQVVSGPCEDFYFFIYPGFVLQGNLIFQMQYYTQGRSTLYVLDSQGTIKLQRQVEAGNNFPIRIDLDTSRLEAGLYFLLVRGTKHQQVERFVVMHL